MSPHIHIPTPGDHYSPATGSAVITIIHELATQHQLRGGQTRIVAGRGTRHDHDVGKCLETAFPPPLSRQKKLADAAAGKVGLRRPFVGSLYKPARDLIPDDFTGPVNLGNPVEMPIRQLAETVLKLVGGKSKLVKAAPLPVDDPLQRCPDITLARDKLKWEPKVALEQGLKKTIEYFDGLLKSNKEISRVGR